MLGTELPSFAFYTEIHLQVQQLALFKDAHHINLEPAALYFFLKFVDNGIAHNSIPIKKINIKRW
jgi:hypothetical protein